DPDGGLVTAVASGKLIALDAASGAVLKEITIGPVFAGPSLSRGQVYVGGGNTLFTSSPLSAFSPSNIPAASIVLVCFPQPPTIGGRYSGRLPQVLAPELHQFHPRALGLFDFRLLHRGCGEPERFPF